jgi:hypothetical protein
VVAGSGEDGHTVAADSADTWLGEDKGFHVASEAEEQIQHFKVYFCIANLAKVVNRNLKTVRFSLQKLIKTLYIMKLMSAF